MPRNDPCRAPDLLPGFLLGTCSALSSGRRPRQDANNGEIALPLGFRVPLDSTAGFVPRSAWNFKPPFFWPEQYRRTGGMSIVFLFDENPNVASTGSGGAAVGGSRSMPDHAARSNSERAAPPARVGNRFSAPQHDGNRPRRAVHKLRHCILTARPGGPPLTCEVLANW